MAARWGCPNQTEHPNSTGQGNGGQHRTTFLGTELCPLFDHSLTHLAGGSFICCSSGTWLCPLSSPQLGASCCTVQKLLCRARLATNFGRAAAAHIDSHTVTFWSSLLTPLLPDSAAMPLLFLSHAMTACCRRKQVCPKIQLTYRATPVGNSTENGL